MLMAIIVCMEKESSKHSVNDISILHDIAENLSSVKMGRYRVRKKFKLDRNADLVEFLQTI